MALKNLQNAGIKTYAFIGPILPMNIKKLIQMIKPYINTVIIDRMNYEAKVRYLYKRYGIERWLERDFIEKVIERLINGFSDIDVEIC
jgi:DNA repair photolyase